MDYKKDLSINKNSLDWEWERQPTLYITYSEQLVAVISRKDKLKDMMEILKSDLDIKIRKDPERYIEGIKITESAIVSVINLNEKIRKVKEEFLEAQKEVGILQAMIEALHHKKSALENMVKLWLGGYYSTPNIPEEAKEKSSSETRDIINSRLKKRKGENNV